MHILSKIGDYYLAPANDAKWIQGLVLACSLTYLGEMGMWIL